MKKEEKKRRFHEALLHMLYPPPPQKDEEEETVVSLNQSLNLDPFPDELEEEKGSASSSGADEVECDDGPRKLTRAQRKRIRKKKIKEAASCRRNIIGPMLPSSTDGGACGDDGNIVKNEAQGVRENAVETPDARNDKPESGNQSSCSKKNKQKQRRMTKKLASESLKSSSSHQDNGLSDKGECSNIS